MAKQVLANTTDVGSEHPAWWWGGGRTKEAVECGGYEKPAQFTWVSEIILDDRREKSEASAGIFIH